MSHELSHLILSDRLTLLLFFTSKQKQLLRAACRFGWEPCSWLVLRLAFEPSSVWRSVLASWRGLQVLIAQLQCCTHKRLPQGHRANANYRKCQGYNSHLPMLRLQVLCSSGSKFSTPTGFQSHFPSPGGPRSKSSFPKLSPQIWISSLTKQQ